MSRRRTLRIVLSGVLLAAATVVGVPGETTCVLAQSPSCRSVCLTEYNKCRLATKGSPTCDGQYQVCLQTCVVQR